MIQADVIWSKAGNTRLLRPDELPTVEIAGTHSSRPTVWVSALTVSELLDKGRRNASVQYLGSIRDQVSLDAIVDLARLMFTLGEKRKRTDDQLRFNTLVTEMPELAKEARTYADAHPTFQPTLDEVTGDGA
jgi:hypothetical protein